MSTRILPALRDHARVTEVERTRLAEPVSEDPELDRLTRMAARIMKVPLAAVTVLDDEMQRFRSSVGLPSPFGPRAVVPLSHSFCKYVVSTARPLVVEDARKHRWLAANPAIEELEMVAYAGVPIRSDGEIIGAFCVSDRGPRRWTTEELNLLKDLAALVEEEVALRRIRLTRAEQPSDPREVVEELLATATRYEALVEQSIVGICIVQDGRFAYVNRRFAEVFGYPQEELLALESVLDLTDPADRARVAENIRKRMDGEVDTLRYPFRGRRKDGAPVDVEVHGTRVELEGRPALVSVLLDVTEQARAERRLRRSEERLRLIVDGAHDAFVVVDMDGRIIDWNAEAERIFGWSREEAVGAQLTGTILPPRYRRAHERAMRRFRDTGDLSLLSRRMEMRARRRDGHEFPVEITVTAVPDNGSYVFCAFLHDVTHRRQAEEALRRNEERFRLLVENSWDIIQILDGDGVIRYVSPSAETVLGYSVDELISRRVEELVHPEDVEAARTAFVEKRSEPGAAGMLELRLRHRDGSWRSVEARGRVLADADGQPSFVVHMHDLTNRKAAEAELARKSLLIDLMRAIAVAANEARTVNDVMRSSLRLICGHIGWPVAHVYLVEPGGELRSTPIWHLREPDRFAEFRKATDEGRFTAEGSLPARVLASREPVWVRNTSRAMGDGDGTSGVGTVVAGGAGFAFPVIAGGEVAAVLEFHHEQPIDPDESFLALIADVGIQLGRVFDRVRAEDALRASDERFQLVSRATNDTIWEWDLAAGRLSWSDIAARVLRYRPEELGDSIDWWYERIHVDDRERVVSDLDAVLEGTGNTWSAEYRFLRGDGQYATVLDRVWVVRTERGAAVRVIGCMLDVSERRQAEEAQRLLGQATEVMASSLEPESSLASLARLIVPELCDFCFVDLLRDGRLRRVALAHADPGMEKILAEAGERDMADEPEDGLLARAMRTADPILITEWAPAANGRKPGATAQPPWLERLRPVSLMVLPLAARALSIGAIVMASADSGRRYGPRDLLMAEELARRCTLSLENARLYRKAREAVSAREEILAVVSHDLRNPLHSIQMATGMLHDAGTERRADNLKWLEIIDRSADGMERMIADLLDISSIDAGRLSIAPADHDVSTILATVCETFQPLAGKSSIELRCEIGTGLNTVWIDSHRIHRVFSNLIGNALKFTPPGGSIELCADRVENEVRFSVKDSGPGIPPDALTHVFDRYWQARRGDRRGAGLGLAIARGIVEQHGGRIWVESPPGRGATFRFTVPIAES
jgi:PAS domain S-box-containing protein